jgi:taurine dioxygenase
VRAKFLSPALQEQVMKITKLSEHAGVAVEGIDLSAPRTAAEDRRLADLYNTHGLVVFKGQKLTKRQLVDACAPFGGAMIDVPAISPDPECPGITVISTRRADGKVEAQDPEKLVGDLEWHADQCYVPVPNRGKFLYAVEVPEEGGMTGFIDNQETYQALPEAMKRRIEGLHVIQDWDQAERYLARNRAYRIDGETMMRAKQFPEVVYPLVYPHPITGAAVLNMVPLFAAGIVEAPGAEGEALLQELIEHVKQERFQYWHRYDLGDCLIWDNWRSVHAASGTPGRYIRTLWSVVINGGPAIGRYLAEAA